MRHGEAARSETVRAAWRVPQRLSRRCSRRAASMRADIGAAGDVGVVARMRDCGVERAW